MLIRTKYHSSGPVGAFAALIRGSSEIIPDPHRGGDAWNKEKRMMKTFFESKSIKTAKRIIVGIVGFTILIIGIAMIVLPGPAIVMIPLGLAILATEFLWARRLLKRLKRLITQKKKEEDKHGSETK